MKRNYIIIQRGIKMWKVILLAATLLMFDGCVQNVASPDMKPASSYQQNSQYGEVVFVKHGNILMGGGGAHELSIDGEFIGSLDDTADAYYIVQLKPGSHDAILGFDAPIGGKYPVKREHFTIGAGERKFYVVEIGNFNRGAWEENETLAGKQFLGYIQVGSEGGFDVPSLQSGAGGSKTASTSSKQPGLGALTAIDKRIEKQNKPVNHSRYALIIGISNYRHQTEVAYADNSARSFKLAATHILGIPEENILYVLDSAATSGEIKTKVAIISDLAEPGDELFVYFAGHGVPGKDGYTYLLPYDMSADAIHMEKRLQLEEIYKTLAASQAKKVTVFMETCFSGKDDKGNLVYKGVAPVLKKRKTLVSSGKLNIMSAGGYDDFANQKESEKERLFTYYLLEGMLDNKTDISDLYSYVRGKVKKDSLKLGIGYKQVPQLIIDGKSR
jgi:hypothetical protein